MTSRILLAGPVLALALTGQAFAQAPIPGDALVAEGEGRWTDALRIYQHALESEAGRADLWSRVADIEARLGRPSEAIRALEFATRASPLDPVLHSRLAQAYGAANQPHAAAASLDRAIEQRPADPEFLRARGALAVWLGDYEGARRYYQRAQSVGRSADSALQLGRVTAWSGSTDEAVGHYREYLAAHPDSPDVWLELANAESWRGNASRAMDALRTFKARFGETPAYSATLARVLASGGRPGHALEVLAPLYRADGGNFDLNVTRTMALAMQRSVGDARNSLASLRQLGRDARETRSAERVVRASVGSSIEPGGGFYSDSDHMEITRVTPSVSVMLPSDTQIAGGYERQLLRAPQASGIGRSDGGVATVDAVWASVSQGAGPFTFTGRAGRASSESADNVPYTLVARYRGSDAFSASFERSDEFFVVSPRTVELGLTQVRHRVDAAWTPTMLASVGLSATTQSLSDGNRRWEVVMAPRYGVVRSEHLNLDVGVAAYVLGTRRDMPDGYYDPHRYESYAAVVYPYFKLGEDAGLGLCVAVGPQRESGHAWEPGGTYSAEASFGIYRAWLLKVGGTAIRNQRLESGAFRGYTGTVVLVRRF